LTSFELTALVVVESDQLDALVAIARSDLAMTAEVMCAVATMPSI